MHEFLIIKRRRGVHLEQPDLRPPGVFPAMRSGAFEISLSLPDYSKVLGARQPRRMDHQRKFFGARGLEEYLETNQVFVNLDETPTGWY